MRPMDSVRPAREADLDELTALFAQALHFGDPGEPMKVWARDWIGLENWRVLHRGGRLAACLGVIRDAHYLGGRPVSTGAISAVAVAPEARGRGAGGALMRSVVQELAAEGLALSTLYPSSHGFYRAFGYERAGERITYEVPLDALRGAGKAREVEARPGTEADRPLLRLLHARAAPGRAGGLVRQGEYFWGWALHPKGGPPRRTLILEQAGEPVGYLVFSEGSQGDPVEVWDRVALTPEAWTRIAELLAGHGTMARAVRFDGAPREPLLTRLPTHGSWVTERLDWMVRVLDPAAALEGRGYAVGRAGRVRLWVDDPLLGSADGAFELEVEGGVGRVRRDPQAEAPSSQDPVVRLDARALGGLVTGHLSTEDARAMDLLGGPAEPAAVLDSLLRGPPVWMRERF